MVVLRITMFIINFVGNELMAMLMVLQALPRSGVTYLSYRSSVIKANTDFVLIVFLLEISSMWQWRAYKPYIMPLYKFVLIDISFTVTISIDFS